MNRTTLEERKTFRMQALESARAAYIALLSGGVQSYAIGSRNLTRLDLGTLSKEITALEKEISTIDSQLNGNGRARRAVGVVPRDW